MAKSYAGLTVQDKEAILMAFNSGWECRSIPAKLGVSARSVSRVLAEYDVNTKRRNRYTLNESYFDVIDTDIKAYLLGLLTADGCVTDTNYIAFESIDQELTALLKSELHYSGDVRIINYEGKPYRPHYRINFSSRQLAQSLKHKGVFSGRTYSTQFYLPEDRYVAAFTLGYFDGDGSASPGRVKTGGCVSIVGSSAMAMAFRQYFGMGKVDRHTVSPVYYWRILGKENIANFYRIVYQFPGLGLLRKKQKMEQILRSYKRG